MPERGVVVVCAGAGPAMRMMLVQDGRAGGGTYGETERGYVAGSMKRDCVDIGVIEERETAGFAVQERGACDCEAAGDCETAACGAARVGEVVVTIGVAVQDGCEAGRGCDDCKVANCCESVASFAAKSSMRAC